MGHQYSQQDTCLSQWIKKPKFSSNTGKRNNKNNKHEEFIIELYQKQLKNEQNDVKHQWMVLDQRRVVFISLFGLYQTWSQCPLSVLYSSLFILPLNRKWLYEPSKYRKEIQNSMFGELNQFSNIFQDEIAFDNFLRLLRWKDHQNLAFWMIDDIYTNDNVQNEADRCVCNDLIAPFWKHLSDKLTKLYDPITGTKYKAIKFNDKWWRFTYGSLINSRYNVARHQILSELYFVTKKFRSIQEILYQSNPGSFNPIIAYDDLQFEAIVSKPKIKGFVSVKKAEADHYGFVPFVNGCCPDLDANGDSHCGNEDEGIWMISTEYDENNLSNDFVVN